jgi:D-alanyl-D-alanine carboxypeptidase/D-alanyl-D-alanine-endopeptidase (penicillin-binding protein 4)
VAQLLVYPKELSAQKRKLTRYIHAIQDSLNSHMGVVLYDITKEKTVYSLNERKAFTPASNVKLLTYLATMHHLTDSIPAFQYMNRNDTIYFTSTGDPSFLNPLFQDQFPPNFMNDTSCTLVYVPDTLYDFSYGKGWMWDDFTYYFSAQKSAAPIYGNLYTVKKDSTGNMHFSPGYFVPHTAITKSLEPTKIVRHANENSFKLNINPDDNEFEVSTPFLYHDSVFTAILSDVIGVNVYLQQSAPLPLQKTTYSFPKDSLIIKLLHDSDNLIAEQLLLMISKEITDSLKTEAGITALENSVFHEISKDIKWVDGSGLSRYNLLSPWSILFVLKKIYKEVPESIWKNHFPQVGKEGTLKQMFDQEPLQIYAKSGSMSGVYNLSGFLYTKKGNLLLFSILNNHFVVSSKEARKSTEGLLKYIIDKY